MGGRESDSMYDRMGVQRLKDIENAMPVKYTHSGGIICQRHPLIKGYEIIVPGEPKLNCLSIMERLGERWGNRYACN